LERRARRLDGHRIEAAGLEERVGDVVAGIPGMTSASR
jgi:hypothetical protein